MQIRHGGVPCSGEDGVAMMIAASIVEARALIVSACVVLVRLRGTAPTKITHAMMEKVLVKKVVIAEILI